MHSKIQTTRAESIVLNTSKTRAFSLIAFWLACTYFLSTFSKFYGTARINADPYHPLHVANHCAKLSPISHGEFLDRQIALVKALHRFNASAYIVEPGANGQFYFNVSTLNWPLSERPLLLIITPFQSGDYAVAKISVLTPKFETTRARMLPIPSNVDYIEWPEDANPYTFLVSTLPKTSKTIFVDGGIRKFLVDGLQEAFGDTPVVTSPEEINRLRERKSAAELDLLRCANEATLLAIREVHKKMYIGIHESEVRKMMATTLSALGLKDGKCLTLFGENAALPHGSGTDRALNKSDFVLLDCTGSLHGYYSDVTRTFALPGSEILGHHLQIWNYVHSTQTIALNAVRAGVLTRRVDEASRSFLESVGYASYFTHRLGHGIGLEVHEEPYLRGGSNTVIKSGHTFSNEPGIYIEGKVGVRLEDCFFINNEGNPIFLTAGVGGQSQSPWFP